MQYKYLHHLLLALILLEVLLTAYLTFENNASTFCIYGSDCASVQNSSYGTLFGMKLTVFGFVMFTLLLIIFLATERHPQLYLLFFSATAIGALFALYFLSLQFFVLHKICSSCVIIDSLAIVIFIVTIFWSRPFRMKTIR